MTGNGRKDNRPRRKAGHRSWAARNAKVRGVHEGDTMSPEVRSRVMARIKSTDTGPERIVANALRELDVLFERHASDLPGRPDIVFRDVKLAVFIDGDFWHGWRFPLWKHKLSAQWQAKIAATRLRDQRNFGRLRRCGWRVIRIWEHQIEGNPEKCVAKIIDALGPRPDRPALEKRQSGK